MRWRQFVKLISIPAWYGFIRWWWVIDQTSTAKDAVGFLSGVPTWMDANPLSWLALAVVWLTGVGFWPEIRDKVLARLPKTTRERLGLIEERLGQGESVAAQAHQSLVQMAYSVKSVVTSCMKTNEYITQISALLTELSRLIAAYEDIRFRLSECKLSMSPFSSWRPLVGVSPDSETSESLVWARDLGIYINRVKRFGFDWSCEATVRHDHLFRCVESWGTVHDPPSGDLCLKWLNEHGANLAELEERRTTEFSEALVRTLKVAEDTGVVGL